MKVLCVGFPKTGTKSINAALTELGYQVYDYEENYYYLSKDWIKIFKYGGTKEDFRRMYQNIDATVDIPPSYFWEEMVEAFPDVKVIFMMRDDEDKWWNSWKRQAISADTNIPLKMLSLFSPTGQGLFRYSRHMGRIIFASRSIMPWSMYGGMSETVCRKHYRDHNKAILAHKFKPGQFLHFRIGDGWEPLCKFLGKPVPNKPFPHKNQRSSLVQDYLDNSPIFGGMKKEMYVFFAMVAAGLSVFAYYKFYCEPGSIYKFLKWE